MIYLKLALEFFKIGLFALGGGPATIPFLSELSDKYGWYTQQELTNMIAVSESTPGPIGLNMATYVGYATAGIPGGVVATMSLVLPSIIVITIIAKFLASFSDNKIVKAVFYGVRPAVAAMIATAVIGIVRTSVFMADDGSFTVHIPLLILFVVIFALLQIKKLGKIHPFFWFVAAAAVGIIFKL